MDSKNKTLSVIEKYKLYHTIDPKGHISFWLAVSVLLLAYPAHILIDSYNPNLFYLDRFGSLSLAFLLFSEFRIDSRVACHHRKTTEIKLDIHYNMIEGLAKKIAGKKEGGSIKEKPKEPLQSLITLSEINKKILPIQNTIIILIVLSTLLWGFGSLLSSNFVE